MRALTLPALLITTALLAACTRAPPPKPVASPVQRPAAVKSDKPAPRPAVAKPAPKPQKPTWVARKVVADAVDVVAATAVVGSGDSLARIAARTNVSAGALAAENGLTAPFRISVGQRLKIPAGRYHRVKPGETGIAIARAYGVAWDRVITDNQLAAPYALAAGQMLRLPSVRSVAAMSLEERARAFKLDIGDVISGSEPAAPAKPVVTRPARETPPAPTPLVEPQNFAGRFAWPIEGRLLSGFGPKAGGRYNDGVNIKAAAGAPVRAASDGVVAYAGDELEGFGGLVIIKHGDGWVTAYAHNEALLVARGDTVKRGTVIARVGSTGSVDQPQLHFEVRRGRTAVDPTRHLPPRAGSGS